MRHRLLVVPAVIIALAVIAGCGADGTTEAAPPSAVSTTSETPEEGAAPTDLDGCVTASDATLSTNEAESTVARVAIMGDGDVGVVISYETSRNVCPWLPLAERLVEAGYRVLLYDTVSGTATDHVVDRAALLREQGVDHIVLVGGSLGGAASIVAATEIQPAVTAVVSLSGGGIDTVDAAPMITMPLLQVVAEDDSPFAGAAVQNDAAATQSPGRELLVLPGRVHASRFFESPDAEQVLTAVVEFIQAHAAAG